MNDLPKGWMIAEVWMPMYYHHERMFQAYQWASKMVKPHWWSRAVKRTGWFPYGAPRNTLEDCELLIRKTDEALRMMP